MVSTVGLWNRYHLNPAIDHRPGFWLPDLGSRHRFRTVYRRIRLTATPVVGEHHYRSGADNDGDRCRHHLFSTKTTDPVEGRIGLYRPRTTANRVRRTVDIPAAGLVHHRIARRSHQRDRHHRTRQQTCRHTRGEHQPNWRTVWFRGGRTRTRTRTRTRGHPRSPHRDQTCNANYGRPHPIATAEPGDEGDGELVGV